MADRKTRPGDDDVGAFLDAVAHAQRRDDARAVTALMEAATGASPRLWGSMIGFGHRPYTTADGTERDWFAVGLAPRKAALTLYGLPVSGAGSELLDRLGPHTTGAGCVYVKRLDDVDVDVLTRLVEQAWAAAHERP